MPRIGRSWRASSWFCAPAYSGSTCRVPRSAAAAKRAGGCSARCRQPGFGLPAASDDGAATDADALDWSRGPRQREPAHEKRSSATGLNPTDRGKLGTKRHVVVDARGTPLGLTLIGANCHHSRMLATMLDAVPGVRTGSRGRPRCRPRNPHADKGYRHRRCRSGDVGKTL